MKRTICPVCKKISMMDDFTFWGLISTGKIINCSTPKMDGLEYCEIHEPKTCIL
jgi:hypothetical protein